MEKASRSYKQPKMKQKEYFEVLQRRQQNGYYGDNPQSLHQLKMQRGAMVQRSYSDAMFKQNKHKTASKQPKTVTVSRNNSNVSVSSRGSRTSSHYSGQYPAYPAGVQRSYSDGIRLVDYRERGKNNNNNIQQNGAVRTNHNRPSSVDLSRSQSSVVRSQKYARPASVDLDNRRPRSILKKSSSFNDLNNNHSAEQDLIFDDEYLDYVSPRDLLSTSDHGGSYHNLNYSFEGELRNDPRQMRAMSPKMTKRVNFNNEPIYYKTTKSNDSKSPAQRVLPQGHPLRRFNSTSLMEERILQQQRLRNQQRNQPAINGHANGGAVYANGGETSPVKKQNASPRSDTRKEQQPFEIRKPLVGGENNVVDFGTYISKKLSKLKFGGKKKDKKNQSSPTKESIRTTHDDNFTMLSGRNGSPSSDNFMDQEVLY
uniref:Uncharacterized protein n=1 Tax=Clytia hemisphaerica TaxID=252671 RepID=A0A7M5V038_9CNID